MLFDAEKPERRSFAVAGLHLWNSLLLTVCCPSPTLDSVLYALEDSAIVRSLLNISSASVLVWAIRIV